MLSDGGFLWLGMPRGTQGTRSLRSLAIFPHPVPRWLEFSALSQPLLPEFPGKASFLTFFKKKSWNFLQKNDDPHYIWLSLILILPILAILSFLIMKIENHIILWISKNFSKKILLYEKKFQIDFKSEIKHSPKLPQNPGNRF